MEQLGIRELRANLAAALRRAGQGERIVVTVAGRPVDGGATIDDLAVRGLLVRARRSDRPEPDVLVDLWTGTRLDRLVGEVRGS